MAIPISLLVIHFIADFFLQSNKMATNKSKSNWWLACHCWVYALCFVPFGPMFQVVTFVTHFVTDYLTSRLTSKLWFFKEINAEDYDTFYKRLFVFEGGSRHWFFVAIGFDQLIHFITLAFIYRWLVG